MNDIWVAGGLGAIGTACALLLSENEKNRVYSSGMNADVRSYDRLKKFLADKNPDVLVYATGINYLDWSEDIDVDSMKLLYDVNVLGLVRCLQVAKNVRRAVVIGSDAARRPMRTSIAYNASKAALEAAVRVIARERASMNFVINIVSPGLIEEGKMTRYVYERTRELRPKLELEQYMLDQIPMGREGRAAEVAMVVKWLVEDAPDYLNGSVIDVNGAR